MWPSIKRLLSEQVGNEETLQYSRLAGGQNHEAWHLRYGEHDYFVKSDNHDCLALFTSEADQLALLAKSGTVRVPQVIAIGADRDNSFLILEYLAAKPLTQHGAFTLGQRLAALHLWSDQPQYGLDVDNAISTTPQPNAWQRRWAHFYAEQRIGWILEIAAEKGLQLGDIDKTVTIVQQKLAHHQPQPALLHGDLWSNNCAEGADGPFIFDPACYWGDRECDLAMLPLYPHVPKELYDGYQSVAPLPSGFLDRQPIYQLYTLINQAVLFGGAHLAIAHDALHALYREAG